MTTIISRQGNTDQNHNEILPHTQQDNQREAITSINEDVEKVEPPNTADRK